jgi:predicted nucleic acid-binding protein
MTRIFKRPRCVQHINLLSDVPIIIGDLILAEILQGFRSDNDFKSAKSYLSDLSFRQMGGYQVALKSAQNYRILRKKGVKVRKTIDVIIGTYCILEGLPLLHDDRDFDPMGSHLSLKILSPEHAATAYFKIFSTATQ